MVSRSGKWIRLYAIGLWKKAIMELKAMENLLLLKNLGCRQLISAYDFGLQAKVILDCCGKQTLLEQQVKRQINNEKSARFQVVDTGTKVTVFKKWLNVTHAYPWCHISIRLFIPLYHILISFQTPLYRIINRSTDHPPPTFLKMEKP